MKKKALLVLTTVLITAVYYSAGYFWQLPIFDCKTPDLGPYDEGYDCLERDVYFIHSELSNVALVFAMYLMNRFLIKDAFLKPLLSISLALSIGGLLDMATNTPNSNWSIFGLLAAILHLAFHYGKKENGLF